VSVLFFFTEDFQGMKKRRKCATRKIKALEQKDNPPSDPLKAFFVLLM
jgi:hypothetical protein